MKSAITAYLRKRACHAAWPIAGASADGVDQAVVIPALAEGATLFDTLGDLAAQDADERARTLVLCVVNNRVPEAARDEDIADNLRTLERLAAWPGAKKLRLAWVDAVSPGRELPAKEGVGLARKIGLDHALAVLDANGHPGGALISLDADTRVAPGYLRSVREYFAAAPRPWAAVADYAHPLGIPEPARSAIIAYECYLRLHELCLRAAKSPYAYPAIGSTIACTAQAYAAADGMKRRQAAEDFYFLQALAKSGPIGRIADTVVYPAARVSHRVPFGTGATITRQCGPNAAPRPTYHPRSYAVLRRFLEVVLTRLDADGGTILRLLGDDSPLAARFLAAQDFPRAWDNIRAQARDPRRRLAQFHRWFDAFRTLKFQHALREAHPDQELWEALPELLQWAGYKPAPTQPEDVLAWLRGLPSLPGGLD